MSKTPESREAIWERRAAEDKARAERMRAHAEAHPLSPEDKKLKFIIPVR
jgi:hypothetical protein